MSEERTFLGIDLSTQQVGFLFIVRALGMMMQSRLLTLYHQLNQLIFSFDLSEVTSMREIDLLAVGRGKILNCGESIIFLYSVI